jgi:hypothetical protein
MVGRLVPVPTVTLTTTGALGVPSARYAMTWRVWLPAADASQVSENGTNVAGWPDGVVAAATPSTSKVT